MKKIKAERTTRGVTNLGRMGYSVGSARRNGFNGG